MVQASPEEAKRLALAYPGFDVVVATSPSADPLESDPQRLNGGKTMMVQVGRRGKYVGAIGFYPDESADDEVSSCDTRQPVRWSGHGGQEGDRG